MKVALFFGSFNPVHIGHLIIAEHVRQHAQVDQLWFVLSPQNPHKKQANLLDDYKRLDLLNLAVEDNPALRVSDIEFSLPKPSYTIHTLSYLKEKYPDYEFLLCMGEDNLRGLPKWKSAAEIVKNHAIIYYPREGGGNDVPLDQDLLAKARLIRCEAPVMHISSSFIRKEIKEGNSCRYVLPDKVWEFIEGSSLYK